MIEELGYSMALWNPQQVIIRFHCAAYPGVPAMPYPNGCVLDLPYADTAVGARILRETKLRSVLEAIVRCLDPDWGRVSTFHVHKAIHPMPDAGFNVGWLTYIADRYAPLPQLPEQYAVSRVGELGSLIVIKGIERLTASNPEHVAMVQQLSEALQGIVR